MTNYIIKLEVMDILSTNYDISDFSAAFICYLLCYRNYELPQVFANENIMTSIPTVLNKICVKVFKVRKKKQKQKTKKHSN